MVVNPLDDDDDGTGLLLSANITARWDVLPATTCGGLCACRMRLGKDDDDDIDDDVDLDLIDAVEEVLDRADTAARRDDGWRRRSMQIMMRSVVVN
jgi:hypothetical protein